MDHLSKVGLNKLLDGGFFKFCDYWEHLGAEQQIRFKGATDAWNWACVETGRMNLLVGTPRKKAPRRPRQ